MNNDDEIESLDDEPSGFPLTNEEAYQLYDFLEHEYISHEFYPLLPSMMRRLLEFVK